MGIVGVCIGRIYDEDDEDLLAASRLAVNGNQRPWHELASRLSPEVASVLRSATGTIRWKRMSSELHLQTVDVARSG
jgi:hypothetical protein